MQALGGLLAALTSCGRNLVAQLNRQLLQVDAREEALHGLSAHARLEEIGQFVVILAQAHLSKSRSSR